jgi:hypothetical protein
MSAEMTVRDASSPVVGGQLNIGSLVKIGSARTAMSSITQVSIISVALAR